MRRTRSEDDGDAEVFVLDANEAVVEAAIFFVLVGKSALHGFCAKKGNSRPRNGPLLPRRSKNDTCR